MPRACYGSLRAFPASRWHGDGACCVQPAEAIADALARIRTETPCGTAPSRQRVYQFHHQGGRRNVGRFPPMIKRVARVAILIPVLAGCATGGHPRPTSATGSSGNWTFYNGSLSGERYSPLNEIKTANVGRLQQVCTFGTPDTVSFQSGIVALPRGLYFTAYNTTYAVDGAH